MKNSLDKRLVAILLVMGVLFYFLFIYSPNEAEKAQKQSIVRRLGLKQVDSDILAVLFQASRIRSRNNPLGPTAFSLLPAFPQDFYLVKAMSENNLIDPTTIKEEYWEQPELSPDFQSVGIPEMLNPPKGRWGTSGFAAYDFTHKDIVSVKKGSTITIILFFHSSWLVQTYQGIALGLKVEGLDSGNNAGMNVNLTPREFVIGPSYPVFRKEWVQRIELNITASGNAGGSYIVSVYPVYPSQEKLKEWNKTYGNVYTQGIDFGLKHAYYSIRVVV